MKKLNLILTLIVLAFSFLTAQTKVIHFKKLQEFLPAKEIKGFKRLNPLGSTQNNGGIASSEASVKYEFIQKTNLEMGEELPPAPKIEIKIADMAGVPYFSAGLQYMGDSEVETEESTQKSIRVKDKYKGQEEVFKAGEGGYKIQFFLANRYMITLEGINTKDLKLPYSIIDAMPLDELEKLTADSK